MGKCGLIQCEQMEYLGLEACGDYITRVELDWMRQDKILCFRVEIKVDKDGLKGYLWDIMGQQLGFRMNK